MGRDGIAPAAALALAFALPAVWNRQTPLTTHFVSCSPSTSTTRSRVRSSHSCQSNPARSACMCAA
ncbi:exported hypothetical protein [Cupriavidus taiwanensis]|nr:exported hypothetical protein [Cupriavidus taiwanensis]SPA14555.1 exported hypothetical protein [Cupriavidus taiwanensis]